MSRRNLKILRPVLEGRVTEDEIKRINDLTVSYYYYLITYDRESTPQEKKKKMIEALEFLIKKPFSV